MELVEEIDLVLCDLWPCIKGEGTGGTEKVTRKENSLTFTDQVDRVDKSGCEDMEGGRRRQVEREETASWTMSSSARTWIDMNSSYSGTWVQGFGDKFPVSLLGWFGRRMSDCSFNTRPRKCFWKSNQEIDCIHDARVKISFHITHTELVRFEVEKDQRNDIDWINHLSM